VVVPPMIARYGPWSYLVWLAVLAAPVLVGQWLAFPGLLAHTARRWLPLAVALAAWLAFTDAIGLSSGVWQVAPRTTLGLRLAGVLPLEEALFFLLTTLMVVQTTVLFLWRFGDLPGVPWRGWRAAFGRRPAALSARAGRPPAPALREALRAAASRWRASRRRARASRPARS